MKFKIIFLFFLIFNTGWSQSNYLALDREYWQQFLEAETSGQNHSVVFSLGKTNIATSLVLRKKGDSSNIITVDNEKVVSRNQIQYFHDLIGKKVIGEEEALSTAFDFLFLKKGHVQIKFKEFLGETAYVLHKNEVYEMQLDEKVLNKLQAKVYLAHLFSKKDEQKRLTELLHSVAGFSTLLKDIEQCSFKKDFYCLSMLYENSGTLKQQEERRLRIVQILKDSFKRRAVFESEKLCKVYESTRDPNLENDNRLPISINIPEDSMAVGWVSLNEMISLDLEKNYITFKGKSLKDGFDRVLIFRKIKEKMKCNNFIEGNIELVKRDGQWRIRELKMENEFQSFL